jgi:hypothetical protein
MTRQSMTFWIFCAEFWFHQMKILVLLSFPQEIQRHDDIAVWFNVKIFAGTTAKKPLLVRVLSTRLAFSERRMSPHF